MREEVALILKMNFLCSDSLTQEDVFTIFVFLLKNNLSPQRAERRGHEARREKCTHENCILPTIHLGPAGRRPALGLVFTKVDISVCLFVTRLLFPCELSAAGAKQGVRFLQLLD